MTVASHPLRSFEDLLIPHADRVLFHADDGHQCHYADALALGQQSAWQQTRRRLVLCVLDNTPGALIGYLGLMAVNAVPMNVGVGLADDKLAQLLALYRPEFIWLPDARAASVVGGSVVAALGGHSLLALPAHDSPSMHGDLALLLSTSGSTGSPKFVRLSHRNVVRNAEAIALYLQLGPQDRPVTSLPPHYTYGLSVIHSHVAVGSAIALTRQTLFDRGFWSFMKDAAVTSFAGVPYHYEMLKKLRFWRQDLPALNLLTQAGGRMDPDASLEMAQEAQRRGIRYVTMYGQVEATARMSYLPPELAIEKAGSIGVPIPGGAFVLEGDEGQLILEAEQTGHLVFRGQNVSMGYAEGRSDLARGDDNQGVLRTGDLARRDADGHYHIVGRQKRFLKLFGHRVNLQDVEVGLQGAGFDVACGGQDDHLKVYAVGVASSADADERIKALVVSQLQVHPSAVSVLRIAHLPRSESGKVLYPALDAMVAEASA